MVGFTDFTADGAPAHTLPVFMLMKAMVSPPINVCISALMVVSPSSLTVEAAI